MALLYWQTESGRTESVELDSTQSEVHEDTLAITDHPVEQGANVVDHAREEPTRLTVEGIVSRLPNPRIDTDAATRASDLSAPIIRDPGTRNVKLDPPKPPLEKSISGLLQAGAGALFGAITGGPNMNAQLTGDPRKGNRTIRVQSYQQRRPRDRIRDVYELLLKAQQQRLLVTVQTRYREHFDMLIERVAVPRAVEDGSSAKFQIDLRRIRIAESETVLAPKPAESRGLLGKSRGSQAAKPDGKGAEKAQVYESTLSQIGGSLF